MTEAIEIDLKNLIIDKIRAQGRISFEAFMHDALYMSRLGYYSGDSIKFGKEGDFVTAPEISSLFSHCLARNFLSVASEIKEASILEFGAGTGKMAADILLALENFQQLPKKYFIIEISDVLKERQRETLAQMCPHLIERVLWLEGNHISPVVNQSNINNSFLSEFHGLIIANEVLDAMPVRRFCLSLNQMYEYYVNERDGDLFIEKIPLKNEAWVLNNASFNYIKNNQLNKDYEFEINFNISRWIYNISAFLKQGVVLIIDYGFPRHEFLHKDRTTGTLMCHHRHKMLMDPLLNIGKQDITTHIDFTLVAESAMDAGMEVLGFTSQAAFLLNSGLLELLQVSQNINNAHALQQNHAVQLLTSPAEMGELFKVIALGKKCDEITLPGFSLYDQRHRL